MQIEVITRETMYHGKAFNVRRDEVRFENHKPHQLDVIEHPGAVTFLPLDAEGYILFVRQYRHAIGKELLELPAGTLNAGEDPETCARREIREETGYSTGKLTRLGEFFLAPGYSTESLTAYLATDLHPDPLPEDEDEFITVVRLSIQQAYDMTLSGELEDGKSIAVLLLARRFLLNS